MDFNSNHLKQQVEAVTFSKQKQLSDPNNISSYFINLKESLDLNSKHFAEILTLSGQINLKECGLNL